MSEHSEPIDPLINTLVAGRYRVLRPLGEGGMGQVYLALHEAIEKQVALKVLRPEYSRKPEIVQRFQQEAISASRIKHPNVLDVFDFGRIESGCFFLAMEYLEGHDLADELVRSRTLPPERGLNIALQVCRALAAAHSRGVVHRDLKPENIFIQRTADGEEIVKIVDFGIAQLRSPQEAAASERAPRRLTRTGMIFGTPEYMAPEQAGGRNADLRVDIYALGVILYEMFTGAVPFTGETFLQVLHAHVNDTAPSMPSVCPDLKISGELQTVIMRALAKDPTQRHATMNDFSGALLSTPEGRALSASGIRMSLTDVRSSSGVGAHAAVATAAQFGQARQSVATPPERASAPPGPNTVALGSSTERAAQPTAASARTGMDEATAGKVRKSGLGLVLALGSLGVLGVGAAIALFVLKPGAGQGAAPTAERPAQVAPKATPEPKPEPKPAEPAPSAQVAPSTTVRLHVETEPAGAVVLKNGFQVCDSTPCDVNATVDETLELEARKAALRGKAKVLAHQDQKVSIRLTGAAPKPKPANRLCERFDENLGIKIMTPCN